MSRGLHPLFKPKHSLGRIFSRKIIWHMGVREPFAEKGNDVERPSISCLYSPKLLLATGMREMVLQIPHCRSFLSRRSMSEIDWDCNLEAKMSRSSFLLPLHCPSNKSQHQDQYIAC